MHEEFQIREKGFSEIKKGIIKKTIPMLILAAGTGLIISFFNTNEQSRDINTLYIVIPLAVAAISFGLFKGINRQKGLFESYKLIINGNEVIREQINTQTISIPHNEIKTITRNSKGIYIIKGMSNTDIIGIPSQINNPKKLEQLLAKIKPIVEADKKPLIEKYKVLLIVLMLGMMALVYISKNKLIVGLTGTFLILFLGYCFYEVRRNKNIDKKTKNAMWWLVLVLLSIVGNMYFKLA